VLAAFTFGYSTASNSWSKKYDAREREIAQQVAIEQDRQWRANERAKQLETEIIEKLQDRERQLQLLLKDNANEANNDPNRDTIGISVDGVLRIDSIK
jgi:hypothetical protein